MKMSSKGKLPKKGRLATRAAYANIVVLAFVLILMTAISAVIINRINSNAAANLVRVYSIEAADKFYSYISQELTLVRKAARSKAITAWIGDEFDEAKKAMAFDEMKDYAGVLTQPSFYMGVRETLNEYMITGSADIADLVPMDRLDPSSAWDSWYFECMESENDYTLNLNAEKLYNTWLFWINHKVITDGESSGVFCSGIGIADIFNSMFGKFTDEKVRGYIIDKNGLIQLDSANDNIHLEEDKKSIFGESDDWAFSSVLHAYLGRINGFFGPYSQPELIKLSSGNGRYVAVEPVGSTDWSMVVFYNGSPFSGMANLIPLLVTMLFSLLLYVLGRNALLSRLFFRPLESLIESVSEGKTADENFFGRDRDDEIGDLARTINTATHDSQRHEELLHAVNSAAAVLLASANDGDDPTPSLFKGVELMGSCVNVDRVHIWQNEVIDGALWFVNLYEWMGSYNRVGDMVPLRHKFPYSAVPGWEESFLRGECINGPVSSLPEAVQEFLRPYKNLSVLLIPMFVEERLWGFVSFDDCRRERTINNNEVNILRSGSMMMVNAVNRNAQSIQLRMAHEHNNLMLNTIPLACSLWGKDCVAFDCNDAALKLFSMKDKLEYRKKFFEISPKYQSDGTLSADSAIMHMKKAFAEGRDVFEWTHQKLDGTPIPSEVTLVRVPYGDDFVLAGYMRDLREHIRMMHDIEKRDNLLNAINRIAAAMLSPTEEKPFEESLLEGMEVMGRFLGADCVQIWPNEMINDTLHFVLRHKWLSEAVRDAPPVEFGTALPYSERWKEMFLKGDCINGPISTLPKEDQELLGPLYLKSTVTIPLFYQDEFWGVFCLDNFYRERYFSDDEVDILRSAGLILVNAMNRNTQADLLHRAHDLLNTVNRVAAILLQSEIDEFDENLQQCMSMMGKAVKADRVCIWKNSIKDSQLCCTQVTEWISNPRLKSPKELSTEVPYEGNIPTWAELLPQAKYINKLVRDLNPDEQRNMELFGIKSVFATPVFVGGEFWGFVGCDNCQSENVFSEDEASILRSGSMLIANALLRNEMTLNLQTAANKMMEALSEAQEANEAKTSFLANMSHEMRTPLNAVIGLSELTLEDSRLDEDALANLEKINSAGATLLSTVNDILDISKIEAGKFELVLTDYQIPSLLNDTITQSVMRIAEKPVHFSLELNENLPTYLHGDDLRVKQIFNNLLSNACKYTREGTVELGVECEREGEFVWLTVSVRDTGIGIKPEDTYKLFDDYAKIDTSANRKIEGAGLGLPITKRLAEMMDGTISVESEYGKGSVFTVRLKQRYVNDEVIGPEVVSSLKNFNYSNQKRRQNSRMVRIRLPYAKVLVVDDVPTNLDVARGMLKPYGMYIDCVNGGQEAIDAIRGEKIKYNAIFMDHMMPGMDGIEATRIIREEIGTEYAKTIPIIALTANAIVGNEEMFLSKGFQAFVSKPLEISRLDSVIRDWVRDKELEKTLDLAVDEDLSLETFGDGNDRRRMVERRSGMDRRIFSKVIPWPDLKRGIERFSGNEETFMHVMRSFAASTRPLLEIVKAVSMENLTEYAVTVHGIKGSSRGICAEDVGNRADALEKAAKEGNFGFITLYNDDFIRETEKLLDGLDEIFSQMDLANPKPKRAEPDKDALGRLLEACTRYDMDGVDLAMAEIDAFMYDNDDGLATWLRTNVDQMNLTEIAEKLRAALPEK